MSTKRVVPASGGFRAEPDEAALRREVLASARAFIARRKAEEATPTFTPSILMHELRIGRNLAASILEELTELGELVESFHVWVPAPAAQPVGRGYALPLSQKEASALLRGLDTLLGEHPTDVRLINAPHMRPGDPTTLREIRRRLKGGPL